MSTDHERIRQLVNTALLRSDFTLVGRWFQQKKNPVVIDVGTNQGGFISQWFTMGAAQVHAFEPVPAVFGRLRQNWGQDARVFLNNVAVSDRVDVVHGVRICGAHTLADPVAAKMDVALEDTGPFDMRLIRLDDYVLASQISVDFVKIDVDGYEPMVLRGMAEVIARFRPAIMIELSFLPRNLGENCEAMIDSIYGAGYKLCTMAGDVCETPLFVLEAFPWRTSFDMVAIPSEKIEASWPRIS